MRSVERDPRAAGRLEARLPLDASERPTYASHPAIPAIYDVMLAEGRDELVHYAMTAHRDDIAWQLVVEWSKDHCRDEDTLRARALAGRTNA